jgi:hypothetical protein
VGSRGVEYLPSAYPGTAKPNGVLGWATYGHCPHAGRRPIGRASPCAVAATSMTRAVGQWQVLDGTPAGYAGGGVEGTEYSRGT